MKYTVKYAAWEPGSYEVLNIIHFEAKNNEEAGAKLVEHIGIGWLPNELEEMNQERIEDGDEPLDIYEILEEMEDRGMSILSLKNDTENEFLYDCGEPCIHEETVDW